MATETTKKKSVKKKAPTATKEKSAKGKAPAETKERKRQQTQDSANRKEYKIARDLDPRMLVPVYNGFSGMMVYRSKKTDALYIWESFGDVQDIELSELKSARNSNKAYFEKNWFLIEDPEVLEYLNALRYYEDALTIDGFDELFEMSPDDIADRISCLSDGQKDTVKFRAKQFIEDGKIDSLSVIDTLEKSLGVQLIER